jgi:hypothetical protein
MHRVAILEDESAVEVRVRALDAVQPAESVVSGNKPILISLTTNSSSTK